MSTMEKIELVSYDSKNTTREQWHYDEDANNGTGHRVEGDDVEVLSHRFAKAGGTIDIIYMKAGAKYGIMTAESDYFYVVLHGSAYFKFYDDNNRVEEEWQPLCDEDAMMIPAGVRFSYYAAEHLGDTEMVLFHKTK